MTERRPAESFVPGFVGTPGQRTFYLQVDDGGVRSWYLLEKGQVAAFAIESTRLLMELGIGDGGADLELEALVEPGDVDFRVAQIQLAYTASDDHVAVTLVPTDGDIPSRVHLVTPAQLATAARAGAVAVEAGRLRCPQCGLAMDPEGHVCPTTNGDLRGHRP